MKTSLYLLFSLVFVALAQVSAQKVKRLPEADMQEFRARMKAAKSDEERQKLKLEMRGKMLELHGNQADMKEAFDRMPHGKVDAGQKPKNRGELPKNFQRNANRVKYEEFKKSIEHLPKDVRMQKMKEFKMRHQPQRRQRAN